MSAAESAVVQISPDELDHQDSAALELFWPRV